MRLRPKAERNSVSRDIGRRRESKKSYIWYGLRNVGKGICSGAPFLGVGGPPVTVGIGGRV